MNGNSRWNWMKRYRKRRTKIPGEIRKWNGEEG
jgi:hypothetical protein